MQRQFRLLWRLAPSGTAYNIGSLFHLRGTVDKAALFAAVRDLGTRHPVLRTIFEEQQGELYAIVADDLSPAITTSDEPVDEEGLQSFFAEPFDLGKGPLVRAHLAPASQGGHWLALVLHHITCDLRSKELLGLDLAALYAHRTGGPLPAPPAQDYATVAQEEETWAHSERAQAALDYFERHLSPLPAPLDLPYAHARPKSHPVLGSRERFRIDGELAARLHERASAKVQKPFLILLANWAVLLARYSNLDRIAVGVPFSNRRSAAREQTVGCFVNNLPLVADIGERSFDEVVAQVRASMLGHHRQQETPMAAIVERLKAPRDPSRNPIFQAGFTFEPPMALPLPGVEVTSSKVHAGGTQLDVFMTLWETATGFEGQIEYASELFSQAMIARLARNYLWQLSSALSHGTLPALGLDALAPDELGQVVRGFNQTDVEWPNPRPLPLLFLEQAERTPDAIALSMGERRLTYAELRARSMQIAAYLVGQGFGRGDRIGLFMDRSLELVSCLLGVGLAGASYVPIDPAYPAGRIANMIEDASPRAVFGQRGTADRWPDGAMPLLIVEELVLPPTPAAPVADLRPADPAYVIFTSGSTGRPKGAINTHLGITNRILWMQDQYRLGADDVILQKTPYGFDVSTWEFFWPLVVGARLEVAPPGAHQDPLALARLIQTAKVTTVHFVPSMLQAFLEHPEARLCTSLRRIIASGEALPSQLVRRCKGVLAAPLHNLYGPTEAAVDVTAWDCQQDPGRDPVPIGKPIANTRMYVLDGRGKPVPIGVPGELFIGGVQVGAGYLARPWRPPLSTGVAQGPPRPR